MGKIPTIRVTREEMRKRVALFSELKGSDGGLPDSRYPSAVRTLYNVIGFQPPEGDPDKHSKSHHQQYSDFIRSSMCSYQRRLTLAASQIFFIGGRRSSWWLGCPVASGCWRGLTNFWGIPPPIPMAIQFPMNLEMSGQDHVFNSMKWK